PPRSTHFPYTTLFRSDRVAEAGEEIGIPRTRDFNTGDNEGSSYFQVNQKRGVRWSAATAFLKPVLKRPNLELRTHVHVERVVFRSEEQRLNSSHVKIS